MSVKSSISLTEQQDAFARSLVDNGRYSSLSAVLQQGLELLRQKMESETIETEALRKLIERRLDGPVISGAEMEERIEDMIERKWRALGVET